MKKTTKEADKTKQRPSNPTISESAQRPHSKSHQRKQKHNSRDAAASWSETDLNLHRKLLHKLISEREYAQANIVAKHLTDLQPQDSYAWHLWGIALLELSDPKRAEFCLLKSMDIADTDDWDCYQMSRARLLLGDTEGAVYWCNRALEINPKGLFFRWHLIDIHKIRGDLATAIVVGKETLAKMAETTDEVRTRLTLANLYLSTSALAEAEEQLNESMKLDPGNAELLSTLGQCLSRQKKCKEALKAFQRASEINPDDPDILYNIADVFLGLGQPQMAVGPLLRAVQLKHDFSLAHYDLSFAYLSMKKYRESEIAARAVLRGDPEMRFQWSNLGKGATENLGLALMNQGRLEEAEACFRRNLCLTANTYFNLGLTLFKTQRFEEALENFQRALELGPGNHECHNLLGQSYDELQQPDEAERYLKRAIEINPDYAMGHYDLGVILAKREGRNQEAFAAFTQALKINPDLAPAYYGIACLHALAGAEQEALTFLSKSLRKGFQNVAYIERDRDWDGLRKNSKFVRLLRKYRDKENSCRNCSVSNQELILEIGAAGGLLSVWSVNAKDGTRSFLVKRDESTLMDFVGKEDASNFNYYSETGHLRSFADALDVLGRYPWHRLYPLFVHQDFIDTVLAAVVHRGGEREVSLWQEKLEIWKGRSPNFNQTDA